MKGASGAGRPDHIGRRVSSRIPLRIIGSRLTPMAPGEPGEAPLPVRLRRGDPAPAPPPVARGARAPPRGTKTAAVTAECSNRSRLGTSQRQMSPERSGSVSRRCAAGRGLGFHATPADLPSARRRFCTGTLSGRLRRQPPAIPFERRVHHLAEGGLRVDLVVPKALQHHKLLRLARSRVESLGLLRGTSRSSSVVMKSTGCGAIRSTVGD